MAMTITADDVLRELLTTDEGKRDPYPLYRALHDLAPFHRGQDDGMWYACRYDTCRQVLLDPHLGHDEEKFFRRPGMTDAQRERMRKRMEKRRQRGFSMVTENPPDHTRLRRLVSRAFTTPRVDQLRDRVVGLVDERLDRMAEEGDVDVMTALAFPLPVTVIGELVGVPPGERDRFRPLITEGMLADRPDATEEDIAKAERNFDELETFFNDLIADRRTDPQDDLLSALIAVHDEDDGRLTHDELMSTVFLLFFAGFVTTTNVIGNGLLALLRNPGEMARLWADGSLVAPAVEEILRYDSPVPFVMRDVLEPTEVEGVSLQPGDPWSPCCRRRTATRPTSPTRTGSTSPGARASRSRSGGASTTTSAPRSPGWRPRSPSPACGNASRRWSCSTPSRRGPIRSSGGSGPCPSACIPGSVIASLGFHRRGTAPAVVARGLGKSFGLRQAVRGVSFEIAGGEIFAFLGSDGAGKSTIIRMLCTLTEPTAGRAAVAGFDVAERPRAVRRRAALVLDDPTFELFRALPDAPDVLFVDEPRGGFDPRTRAVLWHHMRRVRDEGTTVLFATSSIADAEQADRIAIIDDGHIVALDTPAALRATAGSHDVFVHFTGHLLRPHGGDALGAARRFMAAHRR